MQGAGSFFTHVSTEFFERSVEVRIAGTLPATPLQHAAHGQRKIPAGTMLPVYSVSLLPLEGDLKLITENQWLAVKLLLHPPTPLPRQHRGPVRGLKTPESLSVCARGLFATFRTNFIVY